MRISFEPALACSYSLPLPLTERRFAIGFPDLLVFSSLTERWLDLQTASPTNVAHYVRNCEQRVRHLPCPSAWGSFELLLPRSSLTRGDQTDSNTSIALDEDEFELEHYHLRSCCGPSLVQSRFNPGAMPLNDRPCTGFAPALDRLCLGSPQPRAAPASYPAQTIANLVTSVSAGQIQPFLKPFGVFPVVHDLKSISHAHRGCWRSGNRVSIQDNTVQFKDAHCLYKRNGSANGNPPY
jgi:hypothetical protein